MPRLTCRGILAYLRVIGGGTYAPLVISAIGQYIRRNTMYPPDDGVGSQLQNYCEPTAPGELACR